MQYLLGGVKLQGTARIDPTARLCVWSEQRVRGVQAVSDIGASQTPAEVTLGDGVTVGGFVSIYEGANLGDGVVVEDACRIGPHATIGARTRVCYGAYVSDAVVVGADCVIAGFVCDEALVEDGCRIFGALVHEQSQPHLDWWVVNEAPPRILAGSVVGWGAIIVGNVTIGPNAYVAAGAVVTKDVSEGTIVTGVNRVTRREGWLGTRLISWFNHLQNR